VNKNIDDTVGFLTPDVVSNADLDDDEEREGKQGDDVLQDEPEEYYEEDEDEEYVRENEREADEQDHLFNRLQSYSNRSFVSIFFIENHLASHLHSWSSGLVIYATPPASSGHCVWDGNE
jgi:hypothetical protein